MESETQQNLGSNIELASPDTASSDTLTAASGASKKKSKKKDQGSDVAFFASFPCIVIAIVAIALTIIGFLQMGWFSEFCASLRAQLGLVILLCALPPLFAPQVRVPMVIACAIFSAVNLAFVLPCMFPKELPATPEQKELSVLTTNIMQFSVEDPETKVEPIIEEIVRLHPDIVCVTGVPDSVLVKLNEQMPTQYLHRVSFPRDDGNGVTMYSNVPLKGTTLRKVGPDKLPVVATTIHFDYGWYRIILVKVPEATDDKTLQKRNEQLKAAANVIKGLNGHKVVVGNFNMSPYSVAFSDFLKETGLKDTRIGVQPNWSLGPVDLGVLRIPVDHIFASDTVAFKNRYVCPPMGLSHRPLIGEFYATTSKDIPYKEDADAVAEDGKKAPAAAPATKPEKDDEKPAADTKTRKRRKKEK